jgi:prepilin-type N-terminal cleavage/methylation domain-containing protein
VARRILKLGAARVDSEGVRLNRLRDQSGFTLIEVMVAALVLVMGATAAFQLVDGANATTSVNGARTTAVNLTRELTEFARGADYDGLQPTTLISTLRQNPSVNGSGPSPWTIQRRGVTYTVTPSVCTFDDPKDGVAAAGAAPSNACAAGSGDPSVTRTDVNPDDFRRVTFRMNWTIRGRAGSLTQSALVVNPAGGLGPRIVTFTEPTGDITANSVSWGGLSALSLTTSTSPTATGVHWGTDDGVNSGDASGASPNWSFTWNLGTPKLTPLTIDGSWVVDGNYVVQAQAFDGRGVPGEARLVTVHVNRHAPAAVTGLDGGYNSRFGGVVDLRWDANGERDIRGYAVYRGATLICPGDGSAYITARSCTDTNPGSSGSNVYTVRAVDCQSLSSSTCTPRTGTAATKTVNLSASSAPAAPLLVTATIVDGLPKLDWPPVPGAKFYRIYRDAGTGVSGRYDETITSASTYMDPNPGTITTHTYWVTAVDNNYNESAPSPPVTSPVGT